MLEETQNQWDASDFSPSFRPIGQSAKIIILLTHPADETHPNYFHLDTHVLAVLLCLP